MKKEIKLPKISDDADSGLVSEVLVVEGDYVDAEQSIIALESDKATVEVPVEEAGKVDAVKVKEGDEINVGDVLIVLDTDAEDDDADHDKEKEKEKKKEADKQEAKAQKEEQEEDNVEEGKAETKDSTNEEADKDRENDSDKKQETKEKATSPEEEAEDDAKKKGDDIPAAPLARKFARELGIDMEELKRSNDDRITREDVFEHARGLIEKKDREGQSAEQGIVLPDFSKWGETHREPLSKTRRIIARRTIQSWRNIPQVTHFDEADITELSNMLAQKNEKLDTKVTVTSVVLKIVGEALKKFGKFNASIDMDSQELVLKDYYHIGIAADTDRGLLLPVVRDVDQKGISELSEEVNELAEKARSGKLKKEEMEGGNFVISNLGGIGGTGFTPVIFPPQVAILGLSRATGKPVWQDGEFQPRTMLPVALTYDHRLIDGADAARFTKWLCKALESPINMFF